MQGIPQLSHSAINYLSSSASALSYFVTVCSCIFLIIQQFFKKYIGKASTLPLASIQLNTVIQGTYWLLTVSSS